MGFDVEALRAALAHGPVSRVVVAEVRGSAPREVGAAMLVWDGGQSGTIGGGTLEFEAAAAARAGRRGLSRQALGPDLGQCCGGAVTLLTEGFTRDDLARLDAGTTDVLARPVGALASSAPGAAAGMSSAEAAARSSLAQAGAYSAAAAAATSAKTPAAVSSGAAASSVSAEASGTVTAATFGAGPVPLSVERILARARDRGERPAAGLVDGWMVEPLARAVRPLWIWGAGHVGRALVDVLAPLPDLAITWVDTGPGRFPATVPDRVTVLPAATPAALVPHAPQAAEHLILTYSHALDLDLCHALLTHGFAFAGLIGSQTKWARFRSRLAGLGHGPGEIARITCPIGDPALGKHPHAIAIGVAARLLAPSQAARREAIA
ncbi:xanthine dehydrogenase accessory protein XdhC [Marinibacterium sp. SX1]|uniref:xanthine dehydrogenase accessory protein XdhC n=1 Tax=Marinibacterium sp. SX1 TaxID=3388424 RepID=UPI003D17C87F